VKRTSIKLRNVDAAMEAGLRARAARHGRTIEEEARTILYETLAVDLEASANAVRRRSRARRRQR